jgi:hypothetical protein
VVTPSSTKVAKGLAFINASKITTKIIWYLAARCINGWEISKGENGPQNDFKFKKGAKRKTVRGNTTHNRGRSPFLNPQDRSLSWDRNIKRLSSFSICAGDEMKCFHLRWIPYPLTVAQEVSREQVAKIMLEIVATQSDSSFHFIGDESWLLYVYMPIISEPRRHSLLKMLTKFNGRHTLPREQWQQYSSIGQRCIWLIFCLQVRRWTQSVLRSIKHFMLSLVSICYLIGKSCRQRKCVVHFRNTLIHSLKVITDTLAEQHMKRIPPLAYSPDLSL